MRVLYKNEEYCINEHSILRHSDVYQYGWEFLRDGVIPVEDYRHCVCGGVDDAIADEIVKHIAERYAKDESFRKAIADSVDNGDEVSLSMQVDDDEEKPLMEATSKTSEDVHGGDEATKSIENSPSAANEGKEENEENSSEAAGKNSKDEMSSDAAQSGGMTHNASDILAAIENEPFDDKGAVQRAFDHVVRCIRGKAEGGIAKGWDGRKMVKHLLSKQLNRVPNDRKRTGACKTVVVAIDCSGSCWAYLDIINKSLQKLSKTHKVVIVDVSNGFNRNEDVCAHDADPYENRRRLEETFCDGSRIVMHSSITTPSVDTAAKLAEQSEAMIIVADYDGYRSIVESVNLIRNHSKYPWFVDLEERYDDPSDHCWNRDYDTDRYWSEKDWPEAGRCKWLKLFPRGEEY